ncbi:MAG: carbonate dehydratase [Saprospiraceae bacterium]|nr:carbonate dehydratase [Saprospiraceae bacterium]
MSQLYQRLLENNKTWVAKRIASDPDYFLRQSESQSPKFLWIGCSDSRVPANKITGTEAGDVFVHRNIANMVVHSDMNLLSVLDYAVNVLKVRHVIVCGHYGCGGVKAAMGNSNIGIIDNWIRHIKDVYRFHYRELDAIEDEKAKFDRFVELNVVEQVMDLAKTSIVQGAWNKEQDLWIHGWVYDIRNGLVKDLEVNFGSNEELPDVYKLEII